MTITGHLVGLLQEFQLHARAQCTLNQVSPRASKIHCTLEKKKKMCEEITLNEALRVTMDVAPSTRIGKHFPTAGRLEIIVNPKEIYYTDRENISVVKSATEVAYVFESNKAPVRKLVMGLHYDFEIDSVGDPLQGHPIFHAQITNELFDLSSILVEEKVVMDLCSNAPFIRLPTPHMSLTSILLCIGADCFANEDFESFIDSVRTKPTIGSLYSNRLADRVSKNGYASCSWYRLVKE